MRALTASLGHFRLLNKEKISYRDAAFIWVLPETDPETKIRGQVVYLRGARNISGGRWKSNTEKKRQPIRVSY